MTNLHKAIFFDRDGVLNKERKDYVKIHSELEIFPNIGHLIKKLTDAGFLIIIITNQSAINRGFTSHENLSEIQLDTVDKDQTASLDELKTVAPNIPLHVTSCVDNRGIDDLAQYLLHGKTVALLGSSGVGKSSLINQLLGYNRQSTQTVRVRDSRGRHTTVHRELLVHPTSGVIIDTPGMRELRLWDTSESLDATFDDLSSLAEQCRFRDCQHETEPGCAVKTAVEQGQIPVSRLAHYQKLRSEQKQLDDRRLKLAELKEKQSTKQRP